MLWASIKKSRLKDDKTERVWHDSAETSIEFLSFQEYRFFNLIGVIFFFEYCVGEFFCTFILIMIHQKLLEFY